YGSPTRLTFLLTITRVPIIQKVRRHPPKWAPTACTYTVSGSISLPSPGFFSPFPHGTGSLSVSQEYLALEDGPPIFSQDNTCPDLLVFTSHHLSHTGLSPTMAGLSRTVPLNDEKLKGYSPFARRYSGNLG